MQRLEEDHENVDEKKGFKPGDEEGGQVAVKKKSGFVYFRLNAACWLILIHELLERFSFYGMKGLLTLFLKDYLGFSSDISTSIYHLFSAICYLLPVAGAIISDNFLGRFKTVVVFGIVYIVGHALLPLTTLTLNRTGPLIGIFVLAVGTGIIKPCVAAFGGDQTPLDDEEATEAFFSIFYLSINVGSFISQLLTPILKESVDCVDGQCYPLAFGVPAAVFILTYIIFIAGKPLYRFVPGEDSVFVHSLKLIGHSIRRKFRLRKSGDIRDSFLDYGDDSYSPQFINDVKIVLSVLFLYLPFPIFWALFDQQGSRWSVQASQMNGHLTEKFIIFPEQMQMINPLLIVIVIPVFNNIVYPLLNKCNVLTRPPSRMVVGYLFAACSFIYAGLLQIQIDQALSPPELPDSLSTIRFTNLGPCDVRIRATDIDQKLKHGVLGAPLKLKAPQDFDFSFESECKGKVLRLTKKLSLKDKSKYTMGVSTVGPEDPSIVLTPLVLDREIYRKGGKRRFFASPILASDGGVLELIKKGQSRKTVVLDFTNETDRRFYSDYIPIAYGQYSLYYRKLNESVMIQSLEVSTGSIETVSVLKANLTDKIRPLFIEEVSAKLLSIALQVPQYVLMTIGEVLFSVTAMSFAYSESPPSLKAIMQSVYLVTIFFGNMIVTIVAALPALPSQAWEFFLFAGLVFLAGILQGVLAWIFMKDKAKRLGRVNPSFEEKNREMDGKEAEGDEEDESMTKL